MQEAYNKLYRTLDHLYILDEVITEYESETFDFKTFKENHSSLSELLREGFLKELYSKENRKRQMILSDLIEYIITGRGYNFVDDNDDFSTYLEIILRLVNVLMYYDSLTSNESLRKDFLEKLKSNNVTLEKEEEKLEWLKKSRTVAVPEELVSKEDEIPDEVDKEMNESGKKEEWNTLSDYFDTLLPKTVGGLWHELTVYAFLLRREVGHVLPLLLNQRLLHGGEDSLIPPDFLVIREDKSIIGIEVGRKKEIQTGQFSFRTGIPCGTVDTINSRVSDRCPICFRWIQMCPKVIEDFKNLDFNLEDKSEIRCLKDCNRFDREEIAKGKCPYTKYSRGRAKTYEYTHHKFADGKHYHYRCVLENVNEEMREKVIKAEDETALKTHYPSYRGLESLI